MNVCEALTEPVSEKKADDDRETSGDFVPIDADAPIEGETLPDSEREDRALIEKEGERTVVAVTKDERDMLASGVGVLDARGDRDEVYDGVKDLETDEDFEIFGVAEAVD